jgi:polar amino acid transport system substrate-binding protein
MVSDYTGSVELKMIKITVASLSVGLLVSCSPVDQVPSAVRADLAPSGTLRAGINYGNPILAQRDPATGDLRGITVDLSKELARRIGVPVELVPYDAAGKMTDALKTGAWDVAYLAVDPGRAEEISFTAPYLEIEGTYLVPDGSPIRTIADVDRDGVRIAAGAKSAYDLFLSRNLTRATIVRAPTALEAVDKFKADKLEAVAGVRQALVSAAAAIPGSRVLDERFMVIAQAAGVPKGRDAGARYVREFIEDAKASGLVAKALKDSGVEHSATIAPPAPVQ